MKVAFVSMSDAGAIEHEWSTLVDPQRDVGPTRIHGVSARDVHGDLTRHARQPATTQRRTLAAIARSDAGADPKSRYGTKMRIRGNQARRAGQDYRRDRWARLDLDPADVEGWSFGSIEELESRGPR